MIKKMLSKSLLNKNGSHRRYLKYMIDLGEYEHR